MELPVLPFTILALAPLAPIPPDGASARPVDVDLTNLEDTLAGIGPRLYISVPQALCPEGGLTVEIRSMKDFKPDALTRNIPFLARIREAAEYVKDAVAGGGAQAGVIETLKSRFPDLPLDLGAAAQASPKEQISDVDDILAMVAMPGGSQSSTADIRQGQDLYSQVTGLLAQLLGHIFDDPAFRTYEASWRGVDTLVRQGPVRAGRGIRLRLVNTSPETLTQTLTSLSVLMADDLPQLVLVDQPLDSTALGTQIMEQIADFGESLLAPVATWITSRFFFLEDWKQLKKIVYLKHHMEDAAYAKFRKLKELSSANWLVVAVNRFLTRLPYGSENKPKGVDFTENGYLLISPVWALGTLAAKSTTEYGWPSRLTDYANVALENLPLTDLSGGGPSATEMTISEDRLMEFVDAGLTPVLGPLRKDTAILPKETTINGGSLKYQLFTSRVLGFLFWCKDNLDRQIGDGDIAANLTAILAKFWETTGHRPPEDLKVETGGVTESGRIALRITMSPPTSVLPGGKPLELTFAW